ncbi:MAG TPA: helix-turn-helix domain-containing protein [Acidimicrobiales bacterium]|nr:helix-turn-helix domain-containing protein [Acidimicrobiales bacterium]
MAPGDVSSAPRRRGDSTMAQPRSRPAFLTVAEVAAMLRVSNMTVYRLINSGAIPAVRVGKSYRLTEEDVDRYLHQGYTETA